MVPVVWAMPDVDATTAITLATAAARKLAIMGSSQPVQFQNIATKRGYPLIISELKNVESAQGTTWPVPPWSVEDMGAAFVVRDHGGH